MQTTVSIADDAMRRLLIMACSQRKDPTEGSRAAIDRYDGPAFRVLRKYMRAGAGSLPSVLILSAKYGLIPASRKIVNYDCCLTARSADQLRPQVLEEAARIFCSCRWEQIAVCAGKQYWRALAGFEELVPQDVRIDFIKGGQGPRLTALRDWLHQR
jgi:hypothetical protein